MTGEDIRSQRKCSKPLLWKRTTSTFGIKLRSLLTERSSRSSSFSANLSTATLLGFLGSLKRNYIFTSTLNAMKVVIAKTMRHACARQHFHHGRALPKNTKKLWMAHVANIIGNCNCLSLANSSCHLRSGYIHKEVLTTA